MAREIPIGRGLVTIVDDEDFERFGSMKWHAVPARQKSVRFYVKHSLWGGGRPRTVLLHRLVLDAPAGLFVDHKNGDSLDNRRANLRLATRAENAQNSPGKQVSRHGFRGVKLIAKRGKRPAFVACINVDGRRIERGYYGTAEEAGRRYDALALEHHGAFATLNFPAEAL